MANDELHDVVEIEKIEPKGVQIEVNWSESAAKEPSGSQQTYVVTYSLPVRVSGIWQKMFQKPDPKSGVVHQVTFEFSGDGREVKARLKGEPAPELLLVLKKYAERANAEWKIYRERVLANRSEEERILKKLKESQ